MRLSRVRRLGKPEVTFKPLSRNRYRVNGQGGKQAVVKRSMVGTTRSSLLGRKNPPKPVELRRARFKGNGWIDCPYCLESNGKYSWKTPPRPVEMNCIYCRRKFIGEP